MKMKDTGKRALLGRGVVAGVFFFRQHNYLEGINESITRIIGELCGLFWSTCGLRIESLDVRRLAEHLRIQWADHRPDLSEDTIDKGKGWEQYGLISRLQARKGQAEELYIGAVGMRL